MKRITKAGIDELRKMNIEIKTLVLEYNEAIAGLELIEGKDLVGVESMTFVEENKFKTLKTINNKIRKNSINPLVSIGDTKVAPVVSRESSITSKQGFEMHKNGKHFKISRLVMKEGVLNKTIEHTRMRTILEERGVAEIGKEYKRITKRMIQRGIAVQGKFLVPIGEGVKYFGQDSPQVSKFYVNRFDAMMEYIGLDKI